MEILKNFFGFALGAIFTLFLKRSDIARSLLTEGMKICGLEEAWILEGEDYDEFGFSLYKKAQNRRVIEDWLKLKVVEIRAILDEAAWNLDEGKINYMVLSKVNGVG